MSTTDRSEIETGIEMAILTEETFAMGAAMAARRHPDYAADYAGISEHHAAAAGDLRTLLKA